MPSTSPRIYFVRHGATDANDASSEVVRSWMDVPLNEEGRRALGTLRDFFRSIPVHKVLASDLARTMDTGKEVADLHNLRVEPRRDMRPWALGKFVGRPLKEVLSFIQTYERMKSMKVPDAPEYPGESFRDFYRRWEDVVLRAMAWTLDNPHLPLVLVVHSQNFHALKLILENNPSGAVDPKFGPEPGGVLVVEYDGEKWHGI